VYFDVANKYLDHLEKQSGLLTSLGIAGGAHVAQNIGADYAITHPSKSNSLGDRFGEAVRAGAENKPIPTTRKGAFLRGSILPEGNIIPQEGHRLGKVLGSNPTNYDLLALHHTARGNLGHVKKILSTGKATGAERILNHIGLDPKLLKMLPADSPKLKEAGEVIRKDPVAHLLRDASTKELFRSASKHAPTSHGASYGLAGSVASTAVEPGLGILNTTKSIAAHPKLENLPGIKNLRGFLEGQGKKKLHKAVQLGMEGKEIPLAAKVGNRYLYNAFVGRTSELANHLAKVLR